MSDISYRSLARLQYRQFVADKNKGRFIGLIIAFVYFWIIEFVVFFLLKSDGTEIPPLAVILVCASFLVPDFLLKLFILHDNTVMDAFLKTRPVSQERWDRFLTLSQLWKFENLEMPAMLLPACFLFLPFGLGLGTFVVVYLLSCFNGFLIMLLKHRGNYQPEKQVKAVSQKAYGSSYGKNVSSMQIRSFLRSKRLRTAIIWFGVFFYFECIVYSFDHDGLKFTGLFYMITFISLFSVYLSEFGFGVEANFFNGLWTKPYDIYKLLKDKYLMNLAMGGVAALLCLPLCLWSTTSVMDVLSIYVFSAGFGNLITLIDPYKCSPLDLFGKAFFNTQGSSGTFKASVLIAIFVVIGISVAAMLLIPGWKAQALLGFIGIASICASRPYLKWVEGKFVKNRYKYMEKFTSK